jgi:hypothetical protein
MLKAVVDEKLFSWQDTAIWDDQAHEVHYELESFIAKGLFEARGINRFEDLGNGTTKMTVECDFHLHVDKIPGVPKFLINKFKAPAEEAFSKVLKPNLASLAKGLQEYYKGK